MKKTYSLSRETELRLIQEAHDGNIHARNILVLANMGLCWKFARSIIKTMKSPMSDLEIEDMAQEGAFGIIRAIEKFDFTLGRRFSTYASYWIQNSIRQHVMKTALLVRVPSFSIKLAAKWRMANGNLPLSDGHLDMVKHALAAQAHTRRLPFVLQARECHMRTPALANEKVLGDLLEAMGTLDYRSHYILDLVYGFSGEEPMTYAQVARLMGCSREWVRRLSINAVARLAEKVKEV